MKCEKCGQPAHVHMTEIKDGKKQNRHLCFKCAGEAGVPVQIATVRDKLMAFATKSFAAKHGRQPTEDEMKALLDSMRQAHPELFDE